MLLAIDVGNTNIVFAVYDGEILRGNWRLHTHAKRSGDEYAVFLHQVLTLADLHFKDISAVVISSVVPETQLHLQRFCQRHLGCDPLNITKDDVSMEIDMDRPEDVGADRLVNALAVKLSYPQYKEAGAIVVDFGTATTFDVITRAGAYAGGAIAPGIDLSMNALHSAASKLPKIGVRRPSQAIGKTTPEAMRSGIYWGYAGLIERIVGEISSELDCGAPPFVLATGGLAELFKDTGVIDMVDQDLTLKGLLAIYQEMKV